jgi:hypothetical protein
MKERRDRRDAEPARSSAASSSDGVYPDADVDGVVDDDAMTSPCFLAPLSPALPTSRSDDDRPTMGCGDAAGRRVCATTTVRPASLRGAASLTATLADTPGGAAAAVGGEDDDDVDADTDVEVDTDDDAGTDAGVTTDARRPPTTTLALPSVPLPLAFVGVTPPRLLDAAGAAAAVDGADAAGLSVSPSHIATPLPPLRVLPTRTSLNDATVRSDGPSRRSCVGSTRRGDSDGSIAGTAARPSSSTLDAKLRAVRRAGDVMGDFGGTIALPLRSIVTKPLTPGLPEALRSTPAHTMTPSTSALTSLAPTDDSSTERL